MLYKLAAVFVILMGIYETLEFDPSEIRLFGLIG